jgi:aminoglycoside 3-N-acetyltransferase I
MMNSNENTFEIRRLTKEDLLRFKSLINLFNTVFEEDESNIGSNANLSRLLGDNHFIAVVSLDGNEVVGGLTAYELSLYYSEQSEIFLYDLAVKTEHQRKGIGKSLVQKLKDYCIENNIKEFFVLAHEEDEHAIEFYHATGGKSEKVINFLYSQ